MWLDRPTKSGCNSLIFFYQNNIVFIYKKIELTRTKPVTHALGQVDYPARLG